MISYTDLLDVDTWAQVQKAAPKVSEVPYDAAVLAIETLGIYMDNPAHTDLNCRKYWEASLKKLIFVGDLKMEPMQLGRALRALGLLLIRKTDGYHAAWSKEQYQILQQYLKA